jgi:hypothetical protein
MPCIPINAMNNLLPSLLLMKLFGQVNPTWPEVPQGLPAFLCAQEKGRPDERPLGDRLAGEK